MDKKLDSVSRVLHRSSESSLRKSISHLTYSGFREVKDLRRDTRRNPVRVLVCPQKKLKYLVHEDPTMGWETEVVIIRRGDPWMSSVLNLMWEREYRGGVRLTFRDGSDGDFISRLNEWVQRRRGVGSCDRCSVTRVDRGTKKRTRGC